PGADWVFVSQEYYIRDMSGKELAIYSRDEKGRFSLKFWNVWGLSNEGQITSDNNKYYYLKDHLGSIRAVYDGNINLVSAQDYDAWGYALMNRTFGSIGKYQFTSKERDVESSYDYFGARYYDSRIGNWSSPDPLFAKHLQWSPYNYVLRNPMILFDPDGKQINVINGKDFINDFIDNLDIKGVSFDSKTNKLTFNGDLKNRENWELEIIKTINGENSQSGDYTGYTIELNIMFLDESMKYEGKTYVFPGEGFGSYTVDTKNKKIIRTQYFSIPIIDRMDRLSIYDKTDITRHGVLEGLYGAESQLDYPAAHLKSLDKYIMKIGLDYLEPLYFQHDKHRATLKAIYRSDPSKYETIFDIEY
ncbi:MAG TPA: RHS repeat-associated core domain-containing protein, partial [Ignavibacteria bacterium]